MVGKHKFALLPYYPLSLASVKISEIRCAAPLLFSHPAIIEYYTTIPRRGGEQWWYVLRREASRYISSAVHRPCGGQLFSIYYISRIEMKKKVTYCKFKKRDLVGTLFTIYKHVGNFVKCIFTILLQIQHENNFSTYQ